MTNNKIHLALEMY